MCSPPLPVQVGAVLEDGPLLDVLMKLKRCREPEELVKLLKVKSSADIKDYQVQPLVIQL